MRSCWEGGTGARALARFGVDQALLADAGDSLVSRISMRPMAPSAAESALIAKIPAHRLSEDELREFINEAVTNPGLFCLAAEKGIALQVLFQCYDRLADAVAARPGTDPRVAALCIVRWHVLEGLLVRDFDADAVAQVLDDFDAVAGFCEVRTESAANSVIADAGPQPPASLFADMALADDINRLAGLVDQGHWDEAEQAAGAIDAHAQAAYGWPHPLSLELLGRARLQQRRWDEADAVLHEAVRLLQLADNATESMAQAPWRILARLRAEAGLANLQSLRGWPARGLSELQRAFEAYLDTIVGTHWTGTEDVVAQIEFQQREVELEATFGAASLYLQLGLPGVADLLARAGLRWAVTLHGHSPASARWRLLLARVYQARGFYEVSDEHFEEARAAGVTTPRDELDHLGVWLAQGRLDDARAVVDRLRRDAQGDDEYLPDLALAVAEIETRDGATDAGIEWCAHAVELSDRQLERASAFCSDEQFQAQVERHAVYDRRLVHLMFDAEPISDRGVMLAFAAVLRRRGLATDRQRQIAAATGVEPSLRAELAALRSRIGALQLLDRSALEVDARLRDAFAAMERAEIRLAAAVGPLHVRTVDPAAVAAALPPRTALIEYVELPPMPGTSGSKELPARRRVAFWLTATRAGVVRLFDPEAADAAVAAWLDAVVAADPGSVELGDTVRNELVGPLLLSLPIDEIDALLIVPTGALVRLPFGALPVDQHYLFEAFSISYLTSGRDLLPAPTVEPAGPAVVLADPDFDLGMAANADAVFERLPDTAAEGEEIAALLGVAPLTGAAASESALLSVRSPRVLHIATHGWFQDGRTDLRPLVGQVSAARLRAAALRGGGLALAGANAFLAPNSRRHCEAGDGIISAADVLALALGGTRLVVLSACDAGRGGNDVADGMTGLRRAFLVAGARTLVMSLWSVPDEECRLLMRLFYEAVLAGRPCGTALREAQSGVRQRFADPLSWGGFVCVGDPGPLD